MAARLESTVKSGGRVYLCRHGRTPLNAAGLLRGHLDPGLDEVGLAEAERLGAASRGWGITRILASPLMRARQTAEALARRTGLDVIADRRLIDRDYGEWAGSSAEDLVARFGSISAAPGVEPARDVLARARLALEEAYGATDPGDAVVLVSHDIVNRLLLADLDQRLGDPAAIPQATACWNELVHVADGWQVIAVDRHP